MAQDNPEQEPSIEEILASIRQIISDDDGDEPADEPAPPPPPPPKPAAKPAPKPAPKRQPEPEPEPEPEDDDILELTDPLDEPEPEYEPEPERMQIAMQDSDDDDDGESIFTDSAESAAFQGFAKLASRASLDRRGTGDTTIEDIVRELMKPMLREWLDIHLPPLIEKVVQKELRKVAQRATDDE